MYNVLGSTVRPSAVTFSLKIIVYMCIDFCVDGDPQIDDVTQSAALRQRKNRIASMQPMHFAICIQSLCEDYTCKPLCKSAKRILALRIKINVGSEVPHLTA